MPGDVNTIRHGGNSEQNQGLSPNYMFKCTLVEMRHCVFLLSKCVERDPCHPSDPRAGQLLPKPRWTLSLFRFSAKRVEKLEGRKLDGTSTEKKRRREE